MSRKGCTRGGSRVKSFLYKLFIAAMIFLGAGLLAYPTVSNWYNDLHRTRAIANYESALSDLTQVDLDALLAQAREYNQKLPHKPDRFRPSEAELAEYNQILDITGTGIMGYIEIPVIDVKLPVYHTVEETVLQIAAGHMPGTSFPIGETGTHAVVSGHRGLPSAKLFTHLDEVQVGDVFIMHVLGEQMAYRVYAIDTVLPEELDSLAIQGDKDLITLVTCTPYGVNSHRLLVHGEYVDDYVFETENTESETVETVRETSFDLMDHPALVVGGLAVFVIAVLAFLFWL